MKTAIRRFAAVVFAVWRLCWYSYCIVWCPCHKSGDTLGRIDQFHPTDNGDSQLKLAVRMPQMAARPWDVFAFCSALDYPVPNDFVAAGFGPSRPDTAVIRPPVAVQLLSLLQ